MATSSNALAMRRAQQDPAAVRRLLIAAALAVVSLLVIVPVVNVFYEAFSAGPVAYWDAWSAIPTRVTRFC